LGAIFNQEIRKLKLTPRRFIIHPEMNWLYLIESDHVAYTEISKQQKREQIGKVCSIKLIFIKINAVHI
jgi:splicing factor 3B subunit 3